MYLKQERAGVASSPICRCLARLVYLMTLMMNSQSAAAAAVVPFKPLNRSSGL